MKRYDDNHVSGSSSASPSSNVVPKQTVTENESSESRESRKRRKSSSRRDRTTEKIEDDTKKHERHDRHEKRHDKHERHDRHEKREEKHEKREEKHKEREKKRSLTKDSTSSSTDRTTNQPKKVCILSDSICDGIDIRKLNNALKGKVAYKKIYPDATPGDVNYNATKTLKTDKPDICIIHVGTSIIGREDPFIIAGDIMKIVKTCKDKGCDDVFVSGIVYRGDFPDQVMYVNNILRQWQKANKYTFIFNENIDSSCLSFDTRFLNQRGKSRLSSNFRRSLNEEVSEA